jgi:hypothetical protein
MAIALIVMLALVYAVTREPKSNRRSNMALSRLDSHDRIVAK